MDAEAWVGSYSSSQLTRAGLPQTAQGNLGYVNTRDEDRGRDLTMSLLLEGKQENKNAVASGALVQLPDQLTHS